jgi:hypothetical protein
MGHETERSGWNRRDALRAIVSSMGGAASAVWVGDLMVLAEERAAHQLASVAEGAVAWSPSVLTQQQMATVGTLVELIIPATDTPGAGAALVDRFIDGVLSTATPVVRDRFTAGLAWLDARCTTLFSAPFLTATPAQQTDLLMRLAAEPSSEEAAGVQFFTAIKSMTITGYYSTEIGLRQELGDDGILMAASFPGCTHPEHQ